MTAKELAALLTGRSYRHEMTKVEAAQAKADGLVVVFGYSDDGMSFNGAIDDEVGCYDGGTAYLTSAGLLQNKCEDDNCPHFAKLKQSAATIRAIWGTDKYSWVYETAIPHETFEILEDGEKYCLGIVFELSDIKEKQ